MDSQLNRKSYWFKNLRMIGILLVLGFVVTFVVSYFARELSFNFFGWPFSFWMGAQGAVLVYCFIVGFYAWYMERLDREHGFDESED